MATMVPATTFQLPRKDQSQSPLFAPDFPGDIRDKIFTFTLNCYDSTTRKFDKDTPYARPNYTAPQVSDIALLQTCQQVHGESWFRPWVSATHVFFLTWENRRPKNDQITTVQKFQPILDHLFAAHGQVVIQDVRVFAQMWALHGNNTQLPSILDMNDFFPRKVTVTLRHHDWFCWEDDMRLFIDAAWLRCCTLPNSVQEFCLELESLERRKAQVDYVAAEMVNHWHLKNKDGTIMKAEAKDFCISTWRGSSIWNNERWLRDEAEPCIIEYYAKIVTFKTVTGATDLAIPEDIRVPDTFAVIPTTATTKVDLTILDGANIPRDAPSDQASQGVRDHQLAQANEMDARRRERRNQRLAARQARRDAVARQWATDHTQSSAQGTTRAGPVTRSRSGEDT